MKNKNWKSVVILAAVCAYALVGCGKEQEDSGVLSEQSSYFAPIVDALEARNEPDKYPPREWQEEEIRGLDGSDERFVVFEQEYKDKCFTCTYEFKKSWWRTIKREQRFDLTAYLPVQEEGEWDVASNYYDEEKEKIYILLHNYYMDKRTVLDMPGLILLESSLDGKEQGITTYSLEVAGHFFWNADCILLENSNTLFVAGGDIGHREERVAIDLDTKELRSCATEYDVVNAIVQQEFGAQGYKLVQFYPVYEEADIRVYVAEVGNDGFDGPKYAYVYAALQGEEVVDTMTYLVEE